MYKIANTAELASELERLLQHARSYQPSRVRLAAELRGLAKRVANSALDDKEAAALCLIIGLKPPAREKYLSRMDVEYKADDPTIRALIRNGFVTLQGGKNITPQKDKARAALKKIEQPEQYRSALAILNAHTYFKPSE